MKFEDMWPPVDWRELLQTWISVGSVYQGSFGSPPRDFTATCGLQRIGDRWVAVPRFGFPRAPRN